MRREIPFDESGSAIRFVGRKVTGQHEGRFERFRGSVQLVDDDLARSSVRVTVAMASVTPDIAKLSAHLRSSDFLDVERFPEATFVSTRVQPTGPTALVTGDLTLHGVTKRITFPATIQVSPAEFAMTGDVRLRRQDFGITYQGMADDLIQDEVTLTLSVKARP
ncbi:MAG: YceI family protein [Myxococcales bacterium]|nr:MAG: YceI family protein [Myxococcales bacterium]